MAKFFLVCIVALIALFAFTACSQDVVCNEPYMQVGTGCCLDKDGNNICDIDDVDTGNPASEAALAAPAAGSSAVSPAALYAEYADSVYFVKTECVYEYTYPDFFLRSSVDGQWGVRIDLAMKKNDTLSKSGTQTSTWYLVHRVNSTKQYGTAFAVDDVLYTNEHVVECPSTTVDIVDYFDLIDLSGQDVNAQGERIYKDQSNFAEVSTSKDLIANAVNWTVAEHFRSKANFTLAERRIMLYHAASNFTKPVFATLITNGSKFPGTDYAVIAIPGRAHSVKTAPPADPVVGSQVYLIGFPGTIHFEKPELHGDMETNPPIITKGIVSNKILSDNNVTYYVVDAAATFGSSGSPAFSDRGEVIGIVTAKTYGADINLLLPLHAVKR